MKSTTALIIVLVAVFSAQAAIRYTYGNPIYVVVSGSMVPTLEIGDLVIVEKVPQQSIHVGDIIVYELNCNGVDIVHRVISLSAQGVTTQGDNRKTNPQPDPWSPTPYRCVIGKVVLAVPYIGRIGMLIQPPVNYALVALVVGVVYLLERRQNQPVSIPPSGEEP